MIKKAEKQRAALVEKHNSLLKKALSQSDLEIRALELDLAAIDHTIQQHEILIDTTKLGSTQVQFQLRRTNHGAMTRAIHMALSAARPQAMSTDAITAFVCMHCGLQPSTEEYRQIRYSVRKRLKNLVAEGQVARLHSTRGNVSGLWCDTSVAADLAKLVELGERNTPMHPLASVPQAGFREIMARLHGRR